MIELHAITPDFIPKRLLGYEMAGYALRPLSRNEGVSIEDRFFAQGSEETVFESSDINSLVIPDAINDPARIDELAILAEFSLALIATAGHPSFSVIALFSDGACSYAKRLARAEQNRIQFPSRLTSKGLCQWLRRCRLARKQSGDRMHITASRYVRYAKANQLADAILDLSISLESLLETQTEISFKFGACLAKVTGERGTTASDMARLLSELYDVRSKLAHGDPRATKLLKQIEPKLPDLRKLARKILITYVLFLSENTQTQWAEHLRNSLFA
ncbi:MAG: hypothetical protein ACXWID_06595 [Pyrinomonadaceae bacterium]